MKDHKFTFEFNDIKSTYLIWDEWNMADNELDVEYWISSDTACVSGIKFHGVQIIGLIMCLPKEAMEFIEKAAQADYEKRKAAKIKAAAIHPSTDEMLKLK
jgi:hypothetical protein